MQFDLTDVRNDRMTDDIMRIKGFVENHIFADLDEAENIEIRFDGETDLGADGFCTQEEDDSYLIELSYDLRGEDLIRTVIHELIHVRQYVRGELKQIHKDGVGPRMYWHNIDMTDRSYDERPWEQEAHSLEDQLCRQFLS